MQAKTSGIELLVLHECGVMLMQWLNTEFAVAQSSKVCNLRKYEASLTNIDFVQNTPPSLSTQTS
jgi:hypothetical protein